MGLECSLMPFYPEINPNQFSVGLTTSKRCIGNVICTQIIYLYLDNLALYQSEHIHSPFKTDFGIIKLKIELPSGFLETNLFFKLTITNVLFLETMQHLL